MGSGDTKKKTTPLVATLAGAVAGMVETTAIWPMEYVKTHLQLQQRAKNPKYTGMISCARYTLTHHGPLGFYRGLLPVLIGSIPKAGIRFGGFNYMQSLLRGKDGTLSPAKNLLAGTIAGAIESTVAVTPIETLKTKLIHSHTGFMQGSLHIIRTEGIKGVYQGWAATTLKQSSNQGLRFMAFAFYKDFITKRKIQRANTKSGSKDKKPGTVAVSTSLSSMEALVGGMCAGCFSTVCNNPFDMAKTRMQGLEAHHYRNFVHCIVTIVKAEGVLALWQGTFARLTRVVPGQGIIFMSYEKIAETISAYLE